NPYERTQKWFQVKAFKAADHLQKSFQSQRKHFECFRQVNKASFASSGNGSCDSDKTEREFQKARLNLERLSLLSAKQKELEAKMYTRIVRESPAAPPMWVTEEKKQSCCSAENDQLKKIYEAKMALLTASPVLNHPALEQLVGKNINDQEMREAYMIGLREQLL